MNLKLKCEFDKATLCKHRKLKGALSDSGWHSLCIGTCKEGHIAQREGRLQAQRDKAKRLKEAQA